MPATRCTAFAGHRLVASGELRHVALKAKQAFEAGAEPVRVFEDASGAEIALPLQLPTAELMRHLLEPQAAPPAPHAPRTPGRPRLGVVAREVTLLPRHWDWLAVQPGGASESLRRLVDAARADAPDRRRAAQETAYRFLRAMAADAASLDAALRALYAGDEARFEEALAAWPQDVREHAALLAAGAFSH
jgi:hypothetical protein